MRIINNNLKVAKTDSLRRNVMNNQTTMLRSDRTQLMTLTLICFSCMKFKESTLNYIDILLNLV